MKKQTIRTFEEAEAYLYDVPRFTSKNSLEDTKEYLHKLGNPDKKIRIIHVAGTNGKGSVCAYLRSILEEAGKSVCVFTSPHLVDIRERFLIGGEMVSKEDFLEAFLQVYEGLDWEKLEGTDWEEPAVQEGTLGAYHPTFFEYLFFMAMILFANAGADYCILETGLGGRLDATNAVSAKELSVITRISLDHVQYLGDTVEQIAGEKAGIMQAGVPLVFADTTEEVTAVFSRMAEKLGVPMYPVSENDYRFLEFQNKNIDFSLHTRYYDYVRLRLNTIARYQMENASLAVRAIEVLDEGRTISAEMIQRGVAQCFWKGRMEEVLPDVYVDGAHNEDGVRAFLDTVRKDGMEGKRTLLFSAVSDKDCEAIIQKIAKSGLFQKIAITHLQSARAASLESLKTLFLKYPSCEYEVYTSVSEAFSVLLSEKEEKERIYVAGSLYLVGEIKEFLEND
ncbi:MAG: bifunctional folylpolyglutamate synthase/dihydrofolate synthase [Lachnospiraceae bacterium]|nr:bifunctional folylpolyglutamate synthase/dihydrofolate synthase [Lachnospiraceae bacterium]